VSLHGLSLTVNPLRTYIRFDDRLHPYTLRATSNPFRHPTYTLKHFQIFNILIPFFGLAFRDSGIKFFLYNSVVQNIFSIFFLYTSLLILYLFIPSHFSFFLFFLTPPSSTRNVSTYIHAFVVLLLLFSRLDTSLPIR
jgi:hypothetical protein